MTKTIAVSIAIIALALVACSRPAYSPPREEAPPSAQVGGPPPVLADASICELALVNATRGYNNVLERIHWGWFAPNTRAMREELDPEIARSAADLYGAGKALGSRGARTKDVLYAFTLLVVRCERTPPPPPTLTECNQLQADGALIGCPPDVDGRLSK